LVNQVSHDVQTVLLCSGLPADRFSGLQASLVSHYQAWQFAHPLFGFYGYYGVATEFAPLLLHWAFIRPD